MVQWDVFICHAHEDKSFVVLLADALSRANLKVWYDDFVLKIGDSLRRSIDKGLAESRYGVVILSKNFFNKRWTQYELDGLVERDLERKVILPVWHEVDREEVARYSPSLAGKVAIKSTRTLAEIVGAITAVASEQPPDTVPNVDILSAQTSLEKPRLDLARDLPVQSDRPPDTNEEQ